MAIELDYAKIDIQEFLSYLNLYKKVYFETYGNENKELIELIIFNIKKNIGIGQKNVNDIMIAFDNIEFMKNFRKIVGEEDHRRVIHYCYMLFEDFSGELLKNKEVRNPKFEDFMASVSNEVDDLIKKGDQGTLVESGNVISINYLRQLNKNLLELKCGIIDKDEFNYFIKIGNGKVIVNNITNTIDYALYVDNSQETYIKFPGNRTVYKIGKDVKIVEQIQGSIKVTYKNGDTLIINL